MNYGIFVLKTVRSQDYSFPWWNFRSRERMVHGPFISWTIHSRELLFPGTKEPRPFIPRTIRSLEHSFLIIKKL